jgi:hypothetical protein
VHPFGINRTEGKSRNFPFGRIERQESVQNDEQTVVVGVKGDRNSVIRTTCDAKSVGARRQHSKHESSNNAEKAQ